MKGIEAVISHVQRGFERLCCGQWKILVVRRGQLERVVRQFFGTRLATRRRLALYRCLCTGSIPIRLHASHRIVVTLYNALRRTTLPRKTARQLRTVLSKLRTSTGKIPIAATTNLSMREDVFRTL